VTALRPRLLYIDAKWPTPDRDAASQRAVQLVGELVGMGFEVDWGTVDSTQPLTEAGVRGMGTAHPLAEAGTAAVMTHIERHGLDYDIAVVAWTTVGQSVIGALRAANPAMPVVFDTVDVNHVREFRHARVTGNANILRRALAMKAAEVAVVTSADRTIAITDTDAETLRNVAPSSHIDVITMSPEARSSAVPGPGGRADMLFLGSLHAWHNVDAILHIAQDLLPAISESRPGIRLLLAGAGNAQPVDDLTTSSIVRLGRVGDLEAVFDRARMFVCPLRVGSGLKGKVLDALVNGLPIVTTSVGAEGMGLEDGRNCLIADDAAGFAGAVARLDTDDDLWRHLQAAGLTHVASRFSRDIVATQVQQVFKPYLDSKSTNSGHALGEIAVGAAG
jgi:glycosyltransferase involved in cell wall biosynthesis